MHTYLLLRNNKETGPHTLEELAALGLKPYDLVWVNGRSAAWRYPGEIDELKAFAPQVEEQPYDRFYKKEIKEHDSNEEKVNASSKEPVQPPIIPSTSVENDLSKPNTGQTEKKVFVSMPGAGQQDNRHVPAATPITSKEKSVGPANPVNDYPQYQQYQPKNSTPLEKKVMDEPVELEEKFSQPLDEIKEMYVRTLNERKKRHARKLFFKNGFKVAAVIVVVLALGMFIGTMMGSGKNEILSNSAPAIEQEPVDAQYVAQPASMMNEPTEEPLQQPEEKINYRSPLTGNQQPATPSKKTPSKEETIRDSEYQATTTDPNNGERKRVIRSEEDMAANNPVKSKPTGIENIWEDVTLKTNDFKTGPFGGVKDLQLILDNKSSYAIDKVEVEVKYIGMEKQVVKTQQMVFNDIRPGGQVHADVPKSSRGIDVAVSIRKINVKDFSFARSQ